MTAAAAQRAADLGEGAKKRAYAVSVAVAVLTILDLSKVNVALPSIETAFGTGPTELQIIVAGYALAFGLALVPGGRLGDVLSRRTMFLAGLVVFTLFSLACAERRMSKSDPQGLLVTCDEEQKNIQKCGEKIRVGVGF